MKLSIFYKYYGTLGYIAGLVLMEYVRKTDTSHVPSAGHQLQGLDHCNLLKTHVDDTAIDIEEIVTGICNTKKKKKKKKPIRLRSKSRKRLVGDNSNQSTLFFLAQNCLCLAFVFEGGVTSSSTLQYNGTYKVKNQDVYQPEGAQKDEKCMSMVMDMVDATGAGVPSLSLPYLNS